ncbi:MAG TPA: MipA/OmpV family protein [Sphingopyxis sp.]|nr:MipA/OmpV family protein [Sphingopyxis sp.]
MPMPALLSRLALLAFAAAPVQAGAAGLGHDLDALDGADLAPGDAAPAAPPPAPLPVTTGAALLQDSQIDENILLPAAGPDGDEGRKWARDYFAVAAGVISVPDYNGSDERTILPAFYLRGRVSGFAFSTRGTNFQVDLIRQRRGQKTDIKLGPIVNLRSDRSGSVKDPQVDALGKRKLAVELGLTAGITHTGVVTSGYDQFGFRLVALRDISGRHGSWVVSPTLEYGTPLSKRAYIGVSGSMNLYGKGFGRHYFDIDAAGSAASGLPVYEGAGRRATLGKYTVGVAGAYGLSGDLRKRFVLIGGAQYGRVTGSYADSPIVARAGDADQWLFGGGLAYQF